MHSIRQKRPRFLYLILLASWAVVSGQPAIADPTVAVPASANPNPVAGVSTALTALGSDAAGGSDLNYTWTATGPASVAFSANGSNAAQNTTATFQQSGSYSIQVTIQNSSGSISSTVVVTVNQTATALTISPESATVDSNSIQQFTANLSDQFGNAVTPSPGSIGWTDLANTQLQNACPPNFYQGQNYAFYYNCQNVINAWNSGIADTLRNRLIVWGGGHNNYYGNEIYSLNLGVSPPTLTRLDDPSPINTDPSACPPALADGKPNARETFNGLAYISHLDRMFVFNGGLACENGAHAYDTWTLDLGNTSNTGTGGWLRMDPVNGPLLPQQVVGPTSQIAAYDPNTRTVLMDWTNALWQYRYETNSYTVLNSNASVPIAASGVIDPKRKLFIFMGNDAWTPDNTPHVMAIDIAPGDVDSYEVQDWSSETVGCDALAVALAPGLAYDPVLDRIVGWPGTGNTIYIFDPDTKTCTTETFPNGPTNPTDNNGIYGRFRYFPYLNAYAVVSQANLDAFLLRLNSSTTGGPAWNVSGGGVISSSGLFTAGGTASGPFTVSATMGGITANANVTVSQPVATPPLLQIYGAPSELSGTVNGSTITPSAGPSGFSGSVVVNGSGSVNFEQNGNGVYFLTCCANYNNAYYKFTGTAIGNIFNPSQGQISFNLISRYSFAQRQASAALPRYSFDVRDGNGQHLFYFITQAGTNLEFGFAADGNGGTYFVPAGTEDALFGSGVSLQVAISWDGTSVNLYLNGILVKSASSSVPTPAWTAASNFDLGAYEYGSVGGYYASDDIIGDFTVTGPAAAPETTPPSVSITAPANGAMISGRIAVSANATDNVGVTGVRFQVDGTNLGSVVTGAGPSYSVSWNSATVANGSHTLTAIATDVAGLTGTNSVSITVNNSPPTPPSVSITAPANGTTVSGTVSISANATDNVGMAGVQFQLDGVNIGNTVAGAGPTYTLSWNSGTANNGSHTLSAVATDTSGLTATSSVSIVVDNPLTLSCPAGSGQVNTAYTSALLAAGGTQPYSFSITSGSLPDGLALNSTTGAITGTPTSAQTFSFIAGVTDSSSGTPLTVSANCSIAVASAPVGPTPVLQISGSASEISGSTVTPTTAPSGFTGSVAVNGSGSVNFAQNGTGVYFLNCCANYNNAYYKFTGAAIGSIFGSSQGQISFNLISRYSFAQRQATAASPRYAFDVRDGNNNHLFYFLTEITSGRLVFVYVAGGNGTYYYVPSGTEDALLGNGVTLQVTISWDSTSASLYLNNTLVKSVPYTAPSPTWTSASNFDLGAYEYFSSGGYNTSDDEIQGFTVMGN